MIFRSLLRIVRWTRVDGLSRVDPNSAWIDALLSWPRLPTLLLVRLLAVVVLSMMLRHLLELTSNQARRAAFILWAACIAVSALDIYWARRRPGAERVTGWIALKLSASGPEGPGDAALAVLLATLLVRPELVLSLMGGWLV